MHPQKKQQINKCLKHTITQTTVLYFPHSNESPSARSVTSYTESYYNLINRNYKLLSSQQLRHISHSPSVVTPHVWPYNLGRGFPESPTLGAPPSKSQLLPRTIHQLIDSNGGYTGARRQSSWRKF
ncbi:hypothetical protein Nepgr_029617 [Nepenthes gracilis]|uniref:Uncharacterized protein n=1 Tax=Nepenthes gracilis TaxID=150966 RepID=A0AAD3TEM7_NEPGR|nr:hypothetical protein Nepgr_029617 [Nepenthes gracilis]